MNYVSEKVHLMHMIISKYECIDRPAFGLFEYLGIFLMLVSQLTSAVVKVNGNQLCYKRVSSAFKSYQCHLYAGC